MKVLAILVLSLAVVVQSGCGGSGGSNPLAPPLVHAATPPTLQGSFAFQLQDQGFSATGVFTANTGTVSGHLFGSQNFGGACSDTFTGTFNEQGDGTETGTITFNNTIPSQSCFTSGTPFQFTSAVGASSNFAFLTVGQNSDIPVSGIAVLQ